MIIITVLEWLKLLPEERYQKILELLRAKNSVNVPTLTKKFNVSVETIRRDLEYLEKIGLLKRVHGGAVLDKIDCTQLDLPVRERENAELKHEIGEIVSYFIKEGQSIALDASTTNHEVIKVLKTKFKKLTILTNYLPIINELQDMEKYTIIVVGGILHKEEQSIIGGLSEEIIGKLHVDIALLSMTGISLNNGMTDYGFDEVKVKKKMMEIARETFILADSSKFDVVSLLKVCDVNDVDKIITDSKVNENTVKRYKQNGVEIINKIPDGENSDHF